jgi:hypothetical protein
VVKVNNVYQNVNRNMQKIVSLAAQRHEKLNKNHGAPPVRNPGTGGRESGPWKSFGGTADRITVGRIIGTCAG